MSSNLNKKISGTLRKSQENEKNKSLTKKIEKTKKNIQKQKKKKQRQK